MDQFVIALLLGGFFSLLVLCLQYTFDIYDESKFQIVGKETLTTEFEVNIPYSSNVFRDPKNQPWMFTDTIISNIISYFRSELTYYKGDFTAEESIELSLILYDKTFFIEQFFRATKRGKIDNELFNKITTAKFESFSEEKQFLLYSVFKDAHNGLIDDLIAGKLNVRK